MKCYQSLPMGGGQAPAAVLASRPPPLTLSGTAWGPARLSGGMQGLSTVENYNFLYMTAKVNVLLARIECLCRARLRERGGEPYVNMLMEFFLPSPLKVILKVKVNMILSVTFGRRFIGAAQSVPSPRVPAWTTWLPSWTCVSWPSPASASHKCQLGRIIKCQKRKFPSICRASPPPPPPPSGCLHYNVVFRAVILSFSSPGLSCQASVHSNK